MGDSSGGRNPPTGKTIAGSDPMRNPWLDIPLADYEAHMGLPSVGQARLLARIFGETLKEYSPSSVALLGCAGGNGLEHVWETAVERVVCIDINPDYVEATRMRYRNRIRALELFVGDLQVDSFPFRPVDLAFAGLLLEYVDVAAVLPGIHAMLRPGGLLVAVLQMPGRLPEVTPSPFGSLGSLSTIMNLVDPAGLGALAVEAGFEPLDAKVVKAAGGKRFHVQPFRALGPERGKDSGTDRMSGSKRVRHIPSVERQDSRE